MKSGLEILIEK